jgi:long-subunit fatty acid transport protein
VDFGKGRDVELDFNYEQWSQLQQLVLVPGFSIKSDLPSTTITPVAQVNIPLNFQDTWDLRLGGGYRILDGPIRLSVRAGLAYETSVYNNSPGTTVDPQLSFQNFTEYVGALGVTVGFKWIDLVLGYSHVFEPTTTVNSVATTNPNNPGTTMSQNLPGNVAPSNFKPVVVGNGTYATAYDIIGLGLHLKFF